MKFRAYKLTFCRHAFIAKYKATAIVKKDKSVKLNSLDIKLYSNGGSAFDLSGPVMDRALFHVDGPYYWPQFHAEGVPVKTVQPPHTAFRGFGGPVSCTLIMITLFLFSSSIFVLTNICN